MSLPPPLPPNKKGQLRPPAAPGAAGNQVGNPRRFIKTEDLTPASPLPIILSILSIITSAFLFLIFGNKQWIVNLLGYLLTPFAVILLSGFDAILQRKGSAEKEWFVPKPRFATILRMLSVVSLLVAYFHINGLADFLSVQIAKVWPL